jgi:hypothetical protein
MPVPVVVVMSGDMGDCWQVLFSCLLNFLLLGLGVLLYRYPSSGKRIEIQDETRAGL